MAKGLYTQGMCVLLRDPVTQEQLMECLSGFNLVGRHESIDDDDAPLTLVYEYKSDVNGHMLVTPTTSAWPDDMGDPDETPERFVAWSLGQYGPLAYPGCLQRASEQSWGWEQAADEVKTHQAHVRLLISYVLGVEDAEEEDDEIPLVPDEYDPIDELKFLSKAVSSLLELPGAICYFNPGGEVLREEGGLRRGLNHAWNHELPALDMWTNVRLFRAGENWSLMDTVGNGQFDIPDVEAVFPAESYEPGEVEGFLRSVALFLLSGKEQVEDGDTAEGPGEIDWMAMECVDALSDPPRPTIRWIPQDGSDPPEDLLDRGSSPDLDETGWEDEEQTSGDDELDDELT